MLCHYIQLSQTGAPIWSNASQWGLNWTMTPPSCVRKFATALAYDVGSDNARTPLASKLLKDGQCPLAKSGRINLAKRRSMGRRGRRPLTRTGGSKVRWPCSSTKCCNVPFTEFKRITHSAYISWSLMPNSRPKSPLPPCPLQFSPTLRRVRDSRWVQRPASDPRRFCIGLQRSKYACVCEAALLFQWHRVC